MKEMEIPIEQVSTPLGITTIARHFLKCESAMVRVAFVMEKCNSDHYTLTKQQINASDEIIRGYWVRNNSYMMYISDGHFLKRLPNNKSF